MIRLRFLALAAGLALAGCTDARREVAQRHVLANPPAGFAVAAAPEVIPIKDTADGGGEALVSVRYRLLQPTVELRDGFALPRAQEIDQRFTELRGWALGALPATEPRREEVLAAIAAARAPFPVKRVATPAGTEIDALVSFKLRRAGKDWTVTDFQVAPQVPGLPDKRSDIPFEDSPGVTARLDQLEATARQLEKTRREYVAERERIATLSRTKLRAAFRTGCTFTGHLPGGAPIRLVISRGLEDTAGAAAVVLTMQGSAESAARFTGSLIQQPSGETAWRAAQVTTLSAPADAATPLATNAGSRPVLTLFSSGSGLDARLELGGALPVSLSLRPAESVDLIPDPAAAAPDL